MAASTTSRLLASKRSSFFDTLKREPSQFCCSSITQFSCEPIEESRLKRTAYENTYQMEPLHKFRVDLVTELMKNMLTTALTGLEYDAALCPNMCKNISQNIKQKVKEMDFKRYKLVSLVTIGEKKDQGVHVGSRCVWDSDRDNYAEATFESPTLYAVAVLFACYYE